MSRSLRWISRASSLIESDTAKLVREGGRSLMLITHDIEEAVSLADRVIVLSKRPTRVKAVYDIALGSERTDMMAARDSRDFSKLCSAASGPISTSCCNDRGYRYRHRAANRRGRTNRPLRAKPALAPGCARRSSFLRRNWRCSRPCSRFWDHMTANNKQAAFMFGSPSAIAGFLGQMVRTAACGAIPMSPGSKPCSVSGRQSCRHPDWPLALVLEVRFPGR